MNSSYDNLTNRQKTYIDAIREHGPDMGVDITKEEFSRAELRPVSLKMKGKVWIPNWITHDQSRRVSRGVFRIPEVPVSTTVADEAPPASVTAHAVTASAPVAEVALSS
tara:strand:- start:91 stop:417 length:327 start_codon:yes stop_codon:yes gene_type:complete